MSQTVISLLIVILSTVLPKLGVTIGNDALTTTISTILVLGAAIWAWVRRYQAGGINAAGLRN